MELYLKLRHCCNNRNEDPHEIRIISDNAVRPGNDSHLEGYYGYMQNPIYIENSNMQNSYLQPVSSLNNADRFGFNNLQLNNNSNSNNFDYFENSRIGNKIENSVFDSDIYQQEAM
jgi:hypothetical protein